VHVPIMPVALSEAETTATAPLCRQTLRAFGFGGRQRPDGRVVFSAGINATVGHAVTLSDLRDLRLWAPRLLGHWRDIRLGVDLRRCLQQVRCRSTHSPKLIGPAPTLAGNARALQTSLRRMKKLMPDLGEVRIGRTWAGMLDMSPDGLPILDGAAGPAGLVIVTGLSGHGFTLGPVIGEIAADLALTRATSRPIHAFRLRRFREEKVRIPEKMI
jgi:sarcosine oxidase subunit beta